MNTGLIHIYTGDGKGKTTAAMGLALRALGRGFRVEIFQFCKSTDSGELHSLSKLDGVRIHRADCHINKFSWQMDEAEKAQWLSAMGALFDRAGRIAAEGGADVLILDELMGAIHSGAITSAQAAQLIARKAPGTELVLTGRAAPESLIALADYVTEMCCIKHPYTQGIGARQGIEF